MVTAESPVSGTLSGTEECYLKFNSIEDYTYLKRRVLVRHERLCYDGGDFEDCGHRRVSRFGDSVGKRRVLLKFNSIERLYVSKNAESS